MATDDHIADKCLKTVKTICQNARLSIAPMMDWTDRHCRVLHRLLAPHALLYTEMVTAKAVIYGGAERFYAHDEVEHPLALQLGGSSPEELAQAVRAAKAFEFDEINLNVGCPSDRVQNGSFGACLMAEPELVRDCCSAMIEASDVPITVKTRIGIDDSDGYLFFKSFVEQVAASGVDQFIIHARKAWLKGLSPKENRDIPPLDYEQVYKLKRERPDLRIVINGGITELADAANHLEHTDGVMIGRHAYQKPGELPLWDAALTGDQQRAVDVWEALRSYQAYIEQRLALGVPFRTMARHCLGLFHGQPGARAYRRVLSEGMGRTDAGNWLFEAALEIIRDAAQHDKRTHGK